MSKMRELVHGFTCLHGFSLHLECPRKSTSANNPFIKIFDVACKKFVKVILKGGVADSLKKDKIPALTRERYFPGGISDKL